MTKGQGEVDSLVVVVDDDASARQALTSLLQSVGLRVEAFGSAADFLKKGRFADSVAAAWPMHWVFGKQSIDSGGPIKRSFRIASYLTRGLSTLDRGNRSVVRR